MYEEAMIIKKPILIFFWMLALKTLKKSIALLTFDWYAYIKGSKFILGHLLLKLTPN